MLLITLAIGVQFGGYVRQAAGQDAITIERPSGIEGFLPIGALMGWKRFALTGHWDTVHPAAMVLLGWAVVLSLALRKTFCGWFCPIGTLSEGCWRIGRWLFGRNWQLPAWLDWGLRSVKYLLLGFFLWVITGMSTDQITAFVHSPYYKLSDVKMLHFFTRMSGLTAVVLSGLLILSIFLKNFWCRFLCPYGALLGLCALISPTRIQRCESSCISCGRCDRSCPSRLPVSRKRRIISPECTGCMACASSCPVENTLALSAKGLGQGFWSGSRVAVFIAASFLLTIYLASLTGHWRSGVSDLEFRSRLAAIDAPANTHPNVKLKPQTK